MKIAGNFDRFVQIGQALPIEAVITELGNEPILGIGIAGRFRTTLNHGQRVVVEA
ncbi:MAG: hypothetical protein ACR2JC_13870 [Chloroflexota bacterium]